MAKKKKKNISGVYSSIGSEYASYRHKSSKKGHRPMTAAREAVRKEIREIISDAKEAERSIRRKASTVARNGIKDLKIDGARLMNFLKDIKFKETPSKSSNTQHSSSTKRQENIPTHSSPKPVIERMTSPSYYDIWYDLIYTELRERRNV